MMKLKLKMALLLGGVAGMGFAMAAQAQDIIPPKVELTTPGGINVADGAFVHKVVDISVGPLSLERFHVPGYTKPNYPLIGNNMSHSFDIYVAPNVKPADGPPWNTPARREPIVHIGQSASGVYRQPLASLSTITTLNLDAQRSGILAWASGNYVYTDSTGAIYTFTSAVPRQGARLSNSQRIAQIAFADGRVQVFSYNGSNQLKLVNDSSGWAIVFDYNGAGDVSAACGFNTAITYVSVGSSCTGAAVKVSYGYDGSRNLISVTDVGGDVTTYPGNIALGVTCVMPPGFADCQTAMTYVPYGAVQTQTLADDAVWTVTANQPDVVNDPDANITVDGDGVASFTDPDSKTTSFTFSKSSPYTMTDANGNTTQFRFTGALYNDYMGNPYHDGTMLIEADLPEGNKYLAEYSGPFKRVTKETLVAKPGTGLADRVKQYGYGSCFVAPGTLQNCAKPIWIKDPKNNQTDYTYASHGGTLTEMQPAPSAGAPRPLKVYTYVQKYAYIKNASGTLIAAAAPIWMPATETICQTVSGSGNSTPVCDSGALQTVTSFEYGANFTANNLLLRGKVVTSGSTSLRTCYGYDDRGNKIFETSPRAGLAACS